MKRVKVSSVDVYEEKSLMNFPKLARFASSDELPDGVKFAAFYSNDQKCVVLSAGTDRCNYLSSGGPAHCHYLAAVDRNTGECRLTSLHSFQLSPLVAPPAGESAADQSAADQSAVDQSAAGSSSGAAPTQLLNTFGLLRSKRRLERRNRLHVVSHQLELGELARPADPDESQNGATEVSGTSPAPTNTSVPEPTTGATTTSSSGGGGGGGGPEPDILAPPCNWAAVTPQQVYSRADVIPDNVWRHLAAARAAFYEQLDTAEPDCVIVAFIKRLLAASPVSGGAAAAAEEHELLASYAFYLLRLLRYLRKRVLKLKWGGLGIPKPILEHLRPSFMEQSVQGWEKSDRLKDKLVCYLLVVLLWLCQYVIHIPSVSSATGIAAQQLGKYASHLGLKVTRDKAELSVPLVRKSTFARRKSRSVLFQ